MARRLNGADVREGYFYTEDFEEIVQYVFDFLFEIGPCKCEFHIDGLFERHGEQRTFHLTPYVRAFDPDQPLTDEDLWDIESIITDIENFPGPDGSGYCLEAIVAYYLRINRFQPNNNAAESQSQEVGDSDSTNGDENTEERPTTNTTQFFNTLAAAKYPLVGHRRNRPDRRNVNRLRKQWLRAQGFSFPGFLTPSSIEEWHTQHAKQFNIRVFSTHGAVLYQKKLGDPDDETSDTYWDLLWKPATRKWSVIESLWAVFKEDYRRYMCELCHRWHTRDHNCERKINNVKPDQTLIRFKKVQDTKHAFTIYADFEAYQEPEFHLHIPSGYAYIAISKGEPYDSHCVSKTDEDFYIAGRFIQKLYSVCHGWTTNHSQYTPRDMPCNRCGSKQKAYVHNVRYYCNGKVGNYCKTCWTRQDNSAMVFFHNWRGYDSHMIIGELMNRGQGFFILGKSFSKFDTFGVQFKESKKVRMLFKDTFLFLSKPLALLAKQCRTWKVTPENDRGRKGEFPYDWFDAWEKLNATSLPPPEDWFNIITGKMQDYEYALSVWNEKECKTFRDFHDFYLKLDVMLLTDVFEEFRDACMVAEGIDPVFFIGIPGYTWNLAVRSSWKWPVTKYVEHIHPINQFDSYSKNPILCDFAKFQYLFSPPTQELYELIQGNIRGGIAMCVKRYQELESDNDYMLYQDINGLYSFCMEKPLPVAYVMRLTELPETWIEDFTKEDGDYCAFVMCDLSYPEHLHDLHYEYPLAPHRYNQRLCTTFLDKESYYTHATNLEFYLRRGLILTKVHFVDVWVQYPVLRDYVKRNTQKRVEHASNPILVDLYKLLNNALYGKTCENPWKYRRYNHHKAEVGENGRVNGFLDGALQWETWNNNEDFITERLPEELSLEKPVQLGFTILEFAKLEIYKHWYNVKLEFGDSVNLLYTDTDSLLMYFKNQEMHPLRRMIRNESIRSVLDYEKVPDNADCPIRTIGTNKIAGLWAEEADFKKIVAFVGLRAKSYAILFDDDEVKWRNKGIKRSATFAGMDHEPKPDIERLLASHDRKPLKFQMYIDALFDNRQIYMCQSMFRIKNHTLYTRKERKLALSSSDEKRIVTYDKIRTVPFGYKGELFPQQQLLSNTSLGQFRENDEPDDDL